MDEQINNHLSNLYIVIWSDAVKYSKAAYTKEQALKECGFHTVVSVGYLLKNDEEMVILSADSTVGKNSFRGLLSIPKSLVKEVTKVIKQAQVLLRT